MPRNAKDVSYDCDGRVANLTIQELDGDGVIVEGGTWADTGEELTKIDCTLIERDQHGLMLEWLGV